jgi:toxin ParE1/3/4
VATSAKKVPRFLFARDRDNERDLEEIWSYIAEDASATTADRLIDAIIDRFELLAEQPRMGRLRPEFGESVRSFAVENHVIYNSIRMPS